MPEPCFPDEAAGRMASKVQSLVPPWEMVMAAVPGSDPMAWALALGSGWGAKHVRRVEEVFGGKKAVRAFMFTWAERLALGEIMAMLTMRWEVPLGKSRVLTGGISWWAIS